MIKLRIGGVPEHFNLPWHLALEAQRFESLDIELAWRDYPGGSGAMAKALRDGELDAALLLTEGAVAAIADGAAFKIVSLYTDSPLVWGIHVPAASRFRAEAELRGARYAISRMGSGSHLMAFVHARAKGWPVEQLAFVTVGNLAGAVDAFAAGTADVFFWEKFMTKPLVDAEQFRRVGGVHGAVAGVRRLRRGRRRRRAACGDRTRRRARACRSASVAHGPDAAPVIAQRYGLAAADVARVARP